MKDKQVIDPQQNLENGYQQQAQFFYDTVKGNLTNNMDKIPGMFLTMLENNDISRQITLKQYEILGSISYMVGIDFTNQLYLTQKVSENFLKRVQDCGLNAKIMKDYFEIIDTKITEQNIQEAKGKMKDGIIGKLYFKTIAEKNDFRQSFILFKQLINNSTFPVNLAEDTYKTLDKFKNDTATYQDILKVNSLINKSCALNGSKAIKNLVKLYSDKSFVTFLNKASEKYEGQKFAVIFLDGILSVKESMCRYNADDVVKIYSDEIESIDFDKIKTEYEASKPEFEEKVEVQTEKELLFPELAEFSDYQQTQVEKSDKLFDENITRFVYEMFCEFSGKNIGDNPEIAIKIIDEYLKNEDYSQHVYTLLKTKLQGIDAKKYDGVIDPTRMHKLLGKLIEQETANYKEQSEKIFSDIPENNIQKIINYVNACIYDLVLETEDQKQYLISQVMENQIKTYHHLIQIMELIEKANIIGSEILSYHTLHVYVTETVGIKEYFEINSSNAKLHEKISFYMAFNDWFKTFTKTKKPVKKTVAVKTVKKPVVK